MLALPHFTEGTLSCKSKGMSSSFFVIQEANQSLEPTNFCAMPPRDPKTDPSPVKEYPPPNKIRDAT
jgi:hypothetical protein